MDCCAFLQLIFLTQELNPCLLYLLHWQMDSLPLESPGKPHECSLLGLWFNPKTSFCLWVRGQDAKGGALLALHTLDQTFSCYGCMVSGLGLSSPRVNSAELNQQQIPPGLPLLEFIMPGDSPPPDQRPQDRDSSPDEGLGASPFQPHDAGCKQVDLATCRKKCFPNSPAPLTWLDRKWRDCTTRGESSLACRQGPRWSGGGFSMPAPLGSYLYRQVL